MWMNVESAVVSGHITVPQNTYVLVRIKGENLRDGRNYVPVVLKLIDGQFYDTNSELEPFEFGAFVNSKGELTHDIGSDVDYVKIGTERKHLLEWHRIGSDVDYVKIGTERKHLLEWHPLPD